MKILTIVGARPQFVKAAALSRELKQYSNIDEVIVHTGQHFDKNMSDIFFDEMEIPKPKYNLAINSISHGAMTGRMLEEIEEIIIKETPDLTLVFGDANSTLAGALAAKKLHVKIAHVEAGLRSFNIKMPEEVNRILTDRISDYLFCPTENAITNLNNEGYTHEEFKIIKCGDVMQDAAYYYAKNSSEKSTIISRLKVSEFILCTLHRAENTDNPKRLQEIIGALNKINKEISIILPIHPRTKKKISDLNIELNFKTIDPVGYFDMIELIKNSSLVITDSGGLQKEAYFFKKNCVTMRDQTEWVELIENKVNILVGANKKNIVAGVNEMLSRENDFNLNLYGNGNACKIIAENLNNYNL